jgi:hypothetical protein
MGPLTPSTGDSGRKSAFLNKCQNPKIGYMETENHSMPATRCILPASFSLRLFILFNAIYGLINLKDEIIKKVKSLPTP